MDRDRVDGAVHAGRNALDPVVVVFVAVTIMQGDVVEKLRELKDQSVHCVVTSPPYWGLRDYGTARWDGGDPTCDHDTIKARGGRGGSGPNSKNAAGATPSEFAAANCSKCGAIRTDPQIGLEKTPEEYISKLVGVFKELWRVLRDDGTVWLNMGDCYSGSNSTKEAAINPDSISYKSGQTRGGISKAKGVVKGLKPKDLIGMPWRVAFALQAPTFTCH